MDITGELHQSESDTVRRVREIIEADERLTDEVKQALCELFTVAYKQFVGD